MKPKSNTRSVESENASKEANFQRGGTKIA